MLSVCVDHDSRSKVYRGTLKLLLHQAIAVYLEGASLGVDVDIMHLVRETLRVSTHGREGKEPNNTNVGCVLRVAKKEIDPTPGKWCKNRNKEYMISKSKKNTKKKIKKEVGENNSKNGSWTAGGPRQMQILKSFGLCNLMQVGMFWYTSDDAELAITEHAELEDRRITFIRAANRLRARCVKRKNQTSVCTYLVNVRFGEQHIKGSDEVMCG